MMLGLLGWAAVLVGGWLLGAVTLDLFGRRSPSPKTSFDALIILGCRVFPNGEPSTALVERVKLAAALFEAERAPLIITTGGTGDSGHAEAEVAARLLVELGVPRAAIHMETRSTSTQENARYCALQVRARSVLLVSDAYHCLRARRVFARYYRTVATAGSIHPVLWLRAKGALREVPALLLYVVLRWA